MPDSRASSPSLVDRIFDPEYRRNLNVATRQVPLLYALYFLCIPLAKLFVRLGLSPNAITHMSNSLAACSIAALIWIANPWVFPILWLAALMFDIADGIVARTTRSASARGSFFDHMSDQVKVIGLFLGAGLRYDTTETWAATYVVCATFLLLGLINQNRAVRALRLAAGTASSTPAASGAANENLGSGWRGTLRTFMRSRPRLRTFVLGVYSSLFLMYGNSMLWVLPLSFGREAAFGSLLFFWLVTLYSLAGSIRATGAINDQLTAARIPWKS
jgi:phosphatidylglycerophosphate synthase